MPSYKSVQKRHTSTYINGEQPLPSSVQSYLNSPQSEGGRNRVLFAAAAQCRDIGDTEQKAIDTLAEKARQDGLGDHEINNTIASAFRSPPREAPRSSGRADRRPAPKQGARPSRNKAPKPVQLPEPMENGFEKLLLAAFEEGEGVSLSKAKLGDDGKVKPDGCFTLNREKWLERLENADGNFSKVRRGELGHYIAINPIKGNRRAENVTDFRHVLVEFDEGTKQAQYATIKASQLPITAIIDSGNKSVHAWVRVNAQDRAEYDERRAIVFAYFADVEAFDEGNKDPSRLSRCPQGQRTVEGEVKTQALLELRVGASSWDAWVEASEEKSPTDGLISLSGLSRPFPTELLPETPRAIVESFRSVMDDDVPDVMAASAALVAISTAIGSSLRFEGLERKYSSASLYFALGAVSSSGKSEAHKACFKPLKDVETKRRKEFKNITLPRLKAKLEAEENKRPKEEDALNAKFEEIEKLKQQIASRPRLFMEDFTTPSLVRTMEGQPDEALTLESDDARDPIKNLLGKHTKGKTDEGFLTKAWSSTAYSCDRSTDRYDGFIESPWLSILWFVQPDLIAQMSQDSDVINSGFFQRFLICDTGALANAPLGGDIPESVIRDWGDLMEELLSEYRFNEKLYGEPIEIDSEPEARELFVAYARECKELNRGALKEFNSIAGKWNENATRIALVLHAAEHGASSAAHTLSQTTAANAIAIMRWFADEMLKVVRVSISGRRLSRVERLVEIIEDHASDENGLTFGALKNNHGFEASEIEQLGLDFPRKIVVKNISTTSGGGRPSKKACLV